MKLKNSDVQLLLDRVKSEKLKLICFGAGQQLKEACEAFSEFGFYDCIYKIVDSNPKIFTWQGLAREVFFPADVFEFVNPEETIIYISSSFYPEIYEQLERMIRLTTVECYVHDFVKHIPPQYKFKQYQNSDTALIPKKIHYCWFGGKEIPLQNLIWMESWKKHCHDYEIIRWDESNYDLYKNEYICSAYKEKKYAFVSDYARLDIIYEHGGIYLDNDVELLASLDKLLYNKAFCGVCDLYGPSLGLGFGAVPKASIIAELRDYYNDVSFYNEDGTLNQKDCLYHQTYVFKKYGYKKNNMPQIINEMVIYPTDVLSPLNIWRNDLAHTQNTISIHHFDASWFDDDKSDQRKKRLYLYKDFLSKHPIT